MKQNFETIEFLKEGLVVNIRLNRPDKHNALNPLMIAELTTAFSEIANQPELRLVILRGNGSSFCAGADLNYMKEIASFGQEENLEDARKLATLFKQISECAIPVMAVLHGAVYGGANGLSAACDIVLAHEDTVFAFSEVKLGITPATISPFVIARCGQAAARELMLTGRKFTASEGYRFMLVNQVYSDESAEKITEFYVKQLLSSAPNALRQCKELIKMVDPPSTDSAKIFDETTAMIARQRASEEGQEGLVAFFEKRKPNWIL
ncbi:MAG: enoyl-CoA hydratase-related protein [Bacteroidales bacterium]|jgi:methylglutaconyl-CoA hydratase|nr:enoyl-CoA hydratase-related protein [Bacteroidales bacterium]